MKTGGKLETSCTDHHPYGSFSILHLHTVGWPQSYVSLLQDIYYVIARAGVETEGPSPDL